jgi:hypothetical protein
VTCRSWIAVLALALIGVASPAAAQGELVIVKEGTKQYHRPGCPVIRDGRDVMAMTRAQAESRGYKAHPACDPFNPAATTPPAATPGSSPAPRDKPAAPVFVYVSPNDNTYHRESCRKLGTERRKVTLEQAATTRHWPCPVCKPPIRKKGEPIVPPRFPRG